MRASAGRNARRALERPYPARCQLRSFVVFVGLSSFKRARPWPGRSVRSRFAGLHATSSPSVPRRHGFHAFPQDGDGTATCLSPLRRTAILPFLTTRWTFSFLPAIRDLYVPFRDRPRHLLAQNHSGPVDG